MEIVAHTNAAQDAAELKRSQPLLVVRPSWRRGVPDVQATIHGVCRRQPRTIGSCKFPSGRKGTGVVGHYYYRNSRGSRAIVEGCQRELKRRAWESGPAVALRGLRRPEPPASSWLMIR